MNRSKIPSSCVELALLAALFSWNAAAQTAALSLASGTGSPGSVVTLNLSVSATSTQLAGLQWTVNYSTTDIASLTVTSAQSASLTCNNTAGTSTCVEYGTNSNTISNGAVAAIAFTLSSTTRDASSAIQVQNGHAASAEGSAIPTTTSGNTITIASLAPAITGLTSATGMVGQAFSYQITATNSPTSFGASGLPGGLSINTANGVISGTPTAGGSFPVTISATNSGGTGTATLTLVVECSFSLNLNGMTVPVSSSSQQFEINAPGNSCSWTATSAASWLQLKQSGGTGTQVISYNVSANTNALPRSGTMTVGGQTLTVIQKGTKPPIPGDPMGYGKLGLVWTNDTTSQAVWWYLNGTGGNVEASWAWISEGGVPGWHVGAVADFNGDGYSDVFWVNDVTRQAVVWYMGGTGGNVEQYWEWISEAGVPGWSLVGAADFNGDGIPDLLWQNDTTQQVVIWYMSGPATNGAHTWAWLSSSGVPGWGIKAVADFNHDGTPDVVWENNSTGQSVIWYLGENGTVENSWEWISSQWVPGWTITGAGDFNGDGNIDVMLTDSSTGQAIFWYLEGPGTNGQHTWDWVSAAGVPGWWPIVTH